MNEVSEKIFEILCKKFGGCMNKIINFCLLLAFSAFLQVNALILYNQTPFKDLKVSINEITGVKPNQKVVKTFIAEAQFDANGCLSYDFGNSLPGPLQVSVFYFNPKKKEWLEIQNFPVSRTSGKKLVFDYNKKALESVSGVEETQCPQTIKKSIG